MLSHSHWDYNSHRQIRKVYDLVEKSPANQPYFPGKVYGHLRVTEVPMLRFTMAYDGSNAFHPVVPYQLVHLLDLPKLLASKIFFYYVEENWVCRVIRRGPPSSMLKAAILQRVKIF